MHSLVREAALYISTMLSAEELSLLCWAVPLIHLAGQVPALMQMMLELAAGHVS